MLRRGLTGPISRRRRLAALVHRLAGALGARKVDIVGHHGKGGAVVAVLVLIVAGLDAAIYGDQTALGKILAHKVSLRTPCHDIYKISLPLLTLSGKVTITGNAELADVHARRGGAEFRVSHEAAHNCYNIKH